jgi:hypothetical protein
MMKKVVSFECESRKSKSFNIDIGNHFESFR